MTQAAGTIFLTPDKKVLLLRRTSEATDHMGEWSFPGGHIEDGETPEEAARRESKEELGDSAPDGKLYEWTRTNKDGVDFTTFLQKVDEPFTPTLNHEHDDFQWVELKDLQDYPEAPQQQTAPVEQLQKDVANVDIADRTDADFKESEHPRVESGEHAGEFTKGGGTSSKSIEYEKIPQWKHYSIQQKVGKFLYHGSPKKNFISISEEGILPSRGGPGSGNPNSGMRRVARTYFTSYESSNYLGSGDNEGKLFRISVRNLPADIKDDLQGDWFTNTIIPPNLIEVKHNGSWIPISELRKDRSDADFKESEHPRGQPENEGQFVEKGGGASKRAHLSDAPEDKAAWPEHIKQLRLPPAWKEVKISEDPDADLLAIGKDAKGRDQYVYSAKFADSQQAKKFQRIKALESKFESMLMQNSVNMASKDKQVKEAAACQNLIMMMGLRPGGEKETGAEEKAFGATTLEGRHVVAEGGKVSLRFVGKKGVKIDLPVDDKELAADLLQRSKDAGSDGKLFNTNADVLRLYANTLDGGGFKVKDFRTYLGTSTAMNLVKEAEAPTSATAYKKAVMDVAKQVAQKLGNTPSIALKAYISPFVFSGWKHEAGIA